MSAGNLENPFKHSIYASPGSYYNSVSPTLTLHTAAGGSSLDNDSQGRIASNTDREWLVETQTSPDNDLMHHEMTLLGKLGRWYLTVRGTGSAAFYRDGVQTTTPVTFNTTDLWWLVDVTGGVNVMREITDQELSIRVWGASPVHCGNLFFIHRAISYNAVDVLVASPPNTATVSDAGSIATTVADYSTLFDGGLGSPYLGPIFEFTPDLVPAEGIFPFFVARGYTEASTPLSATDPTSTDDTATAIESAVTKNGTQFGDNNPAATTAHSNVYRITPAICQVPLGQTGYPPVANAGGSAVFDNNDVLDIYLALEAVTPLPDKTHALIDQIVFGRDCACAFFDTYNNSNATSFIYSWTDGGCGGTVDSYDMVVTTPNPDDPGNADQPGPVVTTYSNVTSPLSVSGQGALRIYLLPKTADGSYGCYDYDDVILAGGQIIRYR